MGYPVVVHALRVFSVTHEAADVDTAFNFVFVTDYADNRNPLTRPFLLFEDFDAVGEAKELKQFKLTEYVAQVDPRISEKDLETGSRVKINEAYAVVGSARCGFRILGNVAQPRLLCCRRSLHAGVGHD